MNALLILIGAPQSFLLGLFTAGGLLVFIILTAIFHGSVSTDRDGETLYPQLKKYKKYRKKGFDKLFCMFIEITPKEIYQPVIQHTKSDKLYRLIQHELESIIGKHEVCRFSANQFVVIQEIPSNIHMSGEERTTHQIWMTNSIFQMLSDTIASYDYEKLHTTRLTIGTASQGPRYIVKSIEDLIELAHFTKVSAFKMKKNYLVADDHLRAYKSDIDEFKIGLHRIRSNDDNSLNEFTPFFQPIIDLETLRIIGCESLVRWQKDTYRLIEAQQFKDLAYEMNLFDRIDRIVIQRTMSFIQELKQDQIIPDDFKIVINISAYTLLNMSVSELIALTKSYTLKPAQIEFDVKDKVFTDVILQKKISELRTAEYKVALDVFDTESFSLKSFLYNDFDTIKIDKSSPPLDAETSKREFRLYDTIVKMAKELHIQTLIKSIENKTQLEYARRLKADYVQGIYFTCPVSRTDFRTYLKKYREGVISSFPSGSSGIHT